MNREYPALKGKRILLGVSGGIAIYKSLTLLSLLNKCGADTKVIMTDGAKEFIRPLTFQTMSKNRVYSELFSNEENFIPHIDLTREADVFLIAPATANVLAKLSMGLADDLLTSTALASSCPLLVSPAMNVKMYRNKTTQDNISRLRELGVGIIEPNSGLLACNEVGEGRMPEADELLDYLDSFFTKKDLYGRKIIISGGPTRERIDPVRFLTNDSSGKQGLCIAERAYKRGGKVLFVHGKIKEDIPDHINNIEVESTEDMFEAIDSVISQYDSLIMAAAPCDLRAVEVSKNKLKKDGLNSNILPDFVETRDILKSLYDKKEDRIFIGFAAETRNVEEYAKKKMKEKHLDYIVANDVSANGAGFDGDSNIVTIYGKTDKKSYPKLSKYQVADNILDLLR